MLITNELEGFLRDTKYKNVRSSPLITDNDALTIAMDFSKDFYGLLTF